MSAFLEYTNPTFEELHVTTKPIAVLCELLPGLCGPILLVALLTLWPRRKRPGPKVYLDPALSQNQVLIPLAVPQEGHAQHRDASDDIENGKLQGNSRGEHQLT
ncbi:hypothetical protein P885DRAFT_76861 [Corynascus similis CBS 632.67]